MNNTNTKKDFINVMKGNENYIPSILQDLHEEIVNEYKNTFWDNNHEFKHQNDGKIMAMNKLYDMMSVASENLIAQKNKNKNNYFHSTPSINDISIKK